MNFEQKMCELDKIVQQIELSASLSGTGEEVKNLYSRINSYTHLSAVKWAKLTQAQFSINSITHQISSVPITVRITDGSGSLLYEYNTNMKDTFWRAVHAYGAPSFVEDSTFVAGLGIEPFCYQYGSTYWYNPGFRNW